MAGGIHTGMLTFLNISAPLLASIRARSCGVVTITAPVQVKRICEICIPPLIKIQKCLFLCITIN